MARLVPGLALAAALLAGCAAENAGGTGGGLGGSGGGLGGSGGDHAVDRPCRPVDPASWCVLDCRDDYLRDPTCLDGVWTCAAPYRTTGSCPPGERACGGPPPLPGETCTDGVWRCEPDADDWAACPEFLCATCNAFSGSTTVGDCRCACTPDEAGVACARVGPG